MTGGADISLTDTGQLLVASLAGEVDMTNAALVREELSSAVPNQARGLVLDLSEARYLDSAAIEVLFELSRRLVRRRQQLRLVVPAALAAAAPVHPDRPRQRGPRARLPGDAP